MAALDTTVMVELDGIISPYFIDGNSLHGEQNSIDEGESQISLSPISSSPSPSAPVPGVDSNREHMHNSETIFADNLDLQSKRRKFHTCNKDEADFAVLVTNCSDSRLNGLYTLSGNRNGYGKYVECINHQAAIYCNPKRGWTITFDDAVKYYSFPLSSRVPTVVDCFQLRIEWYSQAIDEISSGLPRIKSASVMGAYLLDLLFVGYARNADLDMHSHSNEISIDVVNIVASYFIECRPDKCTACSKTCNNLMLFGIAYLCRECSGHGAFNFRNWRSDLIYFAG